MRVYDFDNTIFRGDSTARFFLFCLRRHPKAVRRLPGLAWRACLFLTRRMEKTAFKEGLFAFLRDVPDIDAAVTLFWQKNMPRVEKWYLEQQSGDDAVISASPEFLLAPACRALDIKTLIASRVDPRDGAYTGANCSGEEKVARFRARFGERVPDEFYSDSHSDDPMAAYAKKAFFVTRGARVPWQKKGRG